MSADRGLVLCRPLGGLNDILCQIELACTYAERFGRTVVVDTAEHSDRYFRDLFSNYFQSARTNLVLGLDAIRGRLDVLDTVPTFLAGRVSRYRTRFDRTQKIFVETETGLPVTFDFQRDYAQPLLIHHLSGGGANSIGALGRLRLQPDLVDTLNARLAVIGPRYLALHIRNTDYRARYQDLLHQIPIDPGSRVFVATDNAESLADCRTAFGAERVFSFADLPVTGGERIHHILEPAQAYERNRDAILDLVMLGLASRLHIFEIEPNAYGARYSGYSVLAANLNANRRFLAQLIGVTGTALST